MPSLDDKSWFEASEAGMQAASLPSRPQALYAARSTSTAPIAETTLTADPTRGPGVRENANILGNLVKDFNFNQKPRRPLILRTHPRFH
jgi:hypothetical protein